MTKKNMVFPARKVPLVLLVTLAVALSGCFSDYGGAGTLVIGLGGGGRLYVNPKEAASLEHEVILKGPGGTITRKIFGQGTLSFELVAGEWDVKVRAIGDRPEDYDALFTGARMLRALGWASVEIKAGKSSMARIDMISATEVSNWDQLDAVIDFISDFPELLPEEIVVVKGELAFDGGTIYINRKITLMAEKNDAVIFHSDYFGNSYFNVYDNGKLTLRGDDGGRLILDGTSDFAVSESFLKIESGGRLEMYDGVILQNNELTTVSGGAINLTQGAFTMYGGVIRNNAAYRGGAVVLNSESTFIMEGGSISGNEAGNVGGGVDVFNGTFDMRGGSISANSSIMAGGGVYVDTGGKFIKTGGTIYGMDAESPLGNDASSGKAVYVTQVGASVISRPEKIIDITVDPGTKIDSENG